MAYYAGSDGSEGLGDMVVGDSEGSDVDVTGDESECEDGELTQDSSTSYSAG